MKSAPFALALLAGACHAPATQHAATPTATTAAATPLPPTTFSLYKFGQRIGVERTTFNRTAGGDVDLKTTFTFNDRGSDVPLAAQWRLGPDGTPRRYQAWGFNARGVSVDERVEVAADGSVEVERLNEPLRHVRAPAVFAAASGYAPVMGQELLVRAWLAHGRPTHLALLPGGDVEVRARGRDTLTLDGKALTLEHLAIHGLVWGREDLWIDDAGRLFALVTRDAEFDHFEAVRRGNEPLLDEFVSRAGADAVAWLAEAARGAAGPAPSLALVGARLVDGSGAPAIEDAVVVVDGDRIVAAGPRASTPIPAGARRIELAGATIIPGLWDMHAHIEQVEQAAAYLAAGVTSVRDVGNIIPFITGVRDAVESGRGVGPRVVVDCIVDGEGKAALGTWRVAAVEEIAPLVERAVKAGCAEIKVYSSVKPPLVAPLAKEAHRRGLRVTGHVPSNMDIVDALDAGFDGVNHIGYMLSLAFPKLDAERDKLSRAELRRRMLGLDLAAPPMQQLIARLAQQHTLYDPTLALMELMTHPAAELARREPGLAKMPRELAGSYGTGFDPDEVKNAHALFEKYVALVREMHRRGVTIVAGTDIGVPGYSLVRELELYVEAGFSPLEAIQSASLVPARALGRDRELGTVAVGKRADLVIIAGNPLTDIHDLRKVRLVVARGRAYEPAALWKVAGFQP